MQQLVGLFAQGLLVAALFLDQAALQEIAALRED